MMGQIDEWFFNSLVGIRPSTTPKQGYQKFIIAPQPVGDLKYVKASYDTLYGTINVDWTCENGTFTLNVSVPVNTTAVVYLPGENRKKYRAEHINWFVQNKRTFLYIFVELKNNVFV